MDTIRERFSTTYIQGYDSYSPEEFFNLMKEKIREAEDNGYTDCRIVFDCNMEPYEDFPGDVELIVRGNRKKTEEELIEETHQKYLYKLAKKKGITYFEASQLHNLMSKGVV